MRIPSLAGLALLLLALPGPARALDAIARTEGLGAALVRADAGRTGYVDRAQAAAALAAEARDGEIRVRTTWLAVTAICNAAPSTPSVSSQDLGDGIGRQLLRADADGDGRVDPAEGRAYVLARPDPASRDAAAVALSMAAGIVGSPILRDAWTDYEAGVAGRGEEPMTLQGMRETEAAMRRIEAQWVESAFAQAGDPRGMLRLDLVLR